MGGTKTFDLVKFTGSIWPVVQRELREGARRPFNFWLRVGSASGACLMLGLMDTANGNPAAAGIELFLRLHRLLLLVLAVTVCGSSADCLAREKRDGTLGLLFLTPLTASGIIVGKCLAQVFRAGTIWLAVVPVLTVTFLVGGVGWGQVGNAVAAEFSLAVLCLAAGLMVSAWLKNRGATFVLTFLLAFSFLFVFSLWETSPLGDFTSMIFPQFRGTMTSMMIPAQVQPQYPRAMRVRSGGSWKQVNPGSMGRNRSGLVPAAPVIRRTVIVTSTGTTLARSAVLATGVLVLATLLAAGFIKRHWTDKTPSVRQEKLVKRYCTPVFLNWFRWKMSAALERNPLDWLQQYSWKTRLSKWGLCLVFVFAECLALNGAFSNSRSSLDFQAKLLAVMAAAYTYFGVNGFLAEKKSGALELILVTPLKVNEIILGRVWGLWKQFLPSGLVIGLSCYYVRDIANVNWRSLNYGSYSSFGSGFGPNDGFVWLAFAVITGFLVLPFFATCFGLRCKNLAVAAMASLIALALPALTVMVYYQHMEGLNILENGSHAAEITGFIFLSYLAMGWLTYSLLADSLVHRKYSF